jgi:hypothetical protein
MVVRASLSAGVEPRNAVGLPKRVGQAGANAIGVVAALDTAGVRDAEGSIRRTRHEAVAIEVILTVDPCANAAVPVAEIGYAPPRIAFLPRREAGLEPERLEWGPEVSLDEVAGPIRAVHIVEALVTEPLIAGDS